MFRLVRFAGFWKVSLHMLKKASDSARSLGHPTVHILKNYIFLWSMMRHV